MAQQPGVSMPAGFGGLMRYGEEYSSKFNLKPTHVIAAIVLVIVLRILLPTFLG
jgi:preprotein translocase subunit Sec61beta